MVQGSACWRTGEESPGPTLIDSGSQAFTIAPLSFFLSGTLQPALKPLAITSVGGDAVAEETMGALLDLAVPVSDRHGVKGFLTCEHVFVYSAELSNGCIVGYLFLKCYWLELDVAQDRLSVTLAEYSEPTVLRQVENNPNPPPLLIEVAPSVETPTMQWTTWAAAITQMPASLAQQMAAVTVAVHQVTTLATIMSARGAAFTLSSSAVVDYPAQATCNGLPLSLGRYNSTRQLDCDDSHCLVQQYATEWETLNTQIFLGQRPHTP